MERRLDALNQLRRGLINTFMWEMLRAVLPQVASSQGADPAASVGRQAATPVARRDCRGLLQLFPCGHGPQSESVRHYIKRVARYSFIQLSETWQLGVNEIAKVSKWQQEDSNPGSLD